MHLFFGLIPQPEKSDILLLWRLLVARICAIALRIFMSSFGGILLINSAIHLTANRSLFEHISRWHMFVPRFFYFNRRGQFTCVEPYSRQCESREKPTVCVFVGDACGWCLLAPQINLLTFLYDTRRNVFIYQHNTQRGATLISSSCSISSYTRYRIWKCFWICAWKFGRRYFWECDRSRLRQPSMRCAVMSAL